LTAGVDFESWEAGLVAIAVEAVVDVSGAGHDSAAGAASIVIAVIAR